MAKVTLLELNELKQILILNIKCQMLINDISPEELAKSAWISRATLYNKLKNGNFTFEELYYISRKLKVKLDDLLKPKEVA